MNEEFDIFDNLNKLANANHLGLPKLNPTEIGKVLNTSLDFDSPSMVDKWLSEAIGKQNSKRRTHAIYDNCRKTKQKDKKQHECKQHPNENKPNTSKNEETCKPQKSKPPKTRKTRRPSDNDDASILCPKNAIEKSVVLPVSDDDGTLLERFIMNRRQCRRSTNRPSTRRSAAVQQTPIDCIDLSSSPIIPVADLDGQAIDLISDEENAQINEINKSFLYQSIRDENPMINVSIVWKGQVESFKLRKYQKFRNIFQIIADRENTMVSNLLFNLDNVIVTPDDTPESINYNTLDCIGGRTLEDSAISNMDKVSNAKSTKENTIKLKIQSDKFKRPFYVDLQRNQHLRILYIKCSEELNLPIEKLTLSFDGDLLKHGDKPIDMEFEGGEVLDLHIKS